MKIFVNKFHLKNMEIFETEKIIIKIVENYFLDDDI